MPLTIAIQGKRRAGMAVLMLLVLALPLASLAPRNVAAAGTYYVSTTGSDATGSGSLAQPWRTIQKAADSVGPGATVLIQPGSYTGAVEIAIAATAASPVIFRGNGAGVVLEAASVARDAVLITESAYVTWENIRIQNAPRAGLRVSMSNHVTIRHNVFANNQRWGLFTDFSDDLLIEGNESFGATIEHGIYHSNSGDRPVIRGNVIHDNYANGLHMNGDVSMGGDGTITSPVVEGNYIYNNGVGGGSGINMDGVERAMIRNNVIVNAHASGISMYQIDGGICSRNNTVYHNTIVVAADGRWAINIPNSGCTGNQLIANILYSNHSYRGAINIVDGARSGFASNYNVLEGVFSTNGGDSILTFTQWKALGYDANSKVSTPTALFVNPSSDFHLKSGSPAINIGTTLASVKTDFDGRVRPQGASSDAGAFEAASPANCRLSPTSGPVYTRIAVTCTGFQPGELVARAMGRRAGRIFHGELDRCRQGHLQRAPLREWATPGQGRRRQGDERAEPRLRDRSVPLALTDRRRRRPEDHGDDARVRGRRSGHAEIPDRARKLPYGREEHRRLQHRNRVSQLPGPKRLGRQLHDRGQRQPRRIRLRAIHPHLRHRRAPHRHTNRYRNSIPNRHQHPRATRGDRNRRAGGHRNTNLDTSQCGFA